MSVEQYQQQLISLLPAGAAWQCNEGDELSKLMLGIAAEFARIDDESDHLIEQIVPSGITSLLARWEKDYGLPDDLSADEPTEQERLAALAQKYLVWGSQSREFLTAIYKSAAGVRTAEIREYKERLFGDDFGENYSGTGWQFVVEFHITADDNYETRRLMALLEKRIRNIIHAHKVASFKYTFQ